MRKTERKNHDEYTVIIGCGRLGSSIANTLSDSGKNVLIIDADKTAFRRLSTNFGGLSVVGDGTDIEELEKANLKKATAVIAVTNHDNTNIMVAQMARQLFSVKQVIARLYDAERESVYKKFGIDTICPAVLSSKEIDRILTTKEEEAPEKENDEK